MKVRIRVHMLGDLEVPAGGEEDEALAQAILQYEKAWNISHLTNTVSVACPPQPNNDVGVNAFDVVHSIVGNIADGDNGEFLKELEKFGEQWKEKIGFGK